MRVLGTLCCCSYCRGAAAHWHPCGCRVGRPCAHAPTHIVVGGELFPAERVVSTGGRRAVWIYLDDGEEAAFLSARDAGRSMAELGLAGTEVGRWPATSHGCWKKRGHQALLVFRRA